MAHAQILSRHQELADAYRGTRNVVGGTKQPSFLAGDEVYRLRLEIGSWLFAARSLLDTISPLLYILHGPGSREYDSFYQYVKALRSGTESDPTMQAFVRANLHWFNRLRDLRDFDAHSSPTAVNFYEEQPGELTVWIQNRWTLMAFITEIDKGIGHFFEYFDATLASRLPEP